MYIITIIGPLLCGINILINGRKYGILGSKILSIITMLISIIIWLKYLIIDINKSEIIINLIDNIIDINNIKENYSIIINKNNIIMSGLILIITFSVIIYSYWYMGEEPHLNRFIAYLLIFSTSMLLLVNSKNLILTYISWEGVGILSYLLINFWYNNINSNKSSMKAIFYNKLGDISLLTIIILIILSYNNSSYSFINNLFTYNPFSIQSYFEIIPYLILIAILAKSAQLIFLPWLGDAMAGPTPVSALLHAATMVTAGVYLTIKLENIMKIYINNILIYENIYIIIIIITIIITGINSLTQNDIKKIIAYSTASQLAIMFISNLYSSNITLFHLITHGFYKALLFLSAGLIIHNQFLLQDIRKLGNLYRKNKLALYSILYSSLSLSAFPYFSGYYSKESIINSMLFINHSYNLLIYLLLLFGAFLTLLYSFRLFYYTFFSFPMKFSNLLYSYNLYFNINRNIYKNIYNKEIPDQFIFPFILLIIFSIFLGYFIQDLFLIETNYLYHNISFDILYTFNHPYILYFILLLPLILFIMLLLYKYPSKYKVKQLFNIFPFEYNIFTFIYILGNRRFFIDNIINYIASLFYSSFYTYLKLIESYLLDIPLFFNRYYSSIFYLSNINLSYLKLPNKSSDFIIDYLILLFFISIFLFLLFLF